MGILDEAIKEHLELKRQHGAGDSELKKLEDEAFGPPERPGAAVAYSEAEAPTEFIAQPEAPEATGTEEAPRRPAPDIADLQEAPEPGPAPEVETAAEEEPPVEEDPSALEHEAIAESAPPAGPSTEEREAIAEQPTELYDVVEEEPEGAEPRAPSEEELVEAEIGEPRLAPVDALAGAEDEGEEEEPEDEPEYGEEEDDFWDEQRLSDELNQALEAPEDPESEEKHLEPEEEHLGPKDGPTSMRSEEDLLEETPDFLEEAPEDDQLWFEQKPPKDFDFDD
ncbi:MAG TPA: hypothetical protein VF770_08780 [Solirubrobacterales bacterium]